MVDKVIVGVDEVGRGCWAGPLVVGAVILRARIDGLTDSKLLTAVRRKELHDIIQDQGDFVGLGWVQPAEVDALGLTKATSLAIERSLEGVPKYDEIIIDGNYNYLPSNPCTRTLIGGDKLVPAISAASIVAKVQRDLFMSEQSAVFPGYGFEKHVGYGTLRHKEALIKFGITPLHRVTYKPIQKLL
jgi:ribonuclease HII